MGGTLDPKTGRIIWEMHVPLQEQRAFYRRHPPRLLERLRVHAIEMDEEAFDGHGEPVNAIFEVQCPCGSRRFIAVGYGLEDGLVEPPITLECAGCGSERLLFDPARHGYDGAVGNNGEPQEPEGEC